MPAEKVIFTVLTGGYDRLEQPVCVRPDWDYVCLGDRDGRDGIWQLRRIPFGGSSVDRARQAKLQPHRLLPEYRWSVFMDANLCITGEAFYEQVEAAMAAGRHLAFLPHPERDCVFDELRYCYLKDKLGTRAALRHFRRLKSLRMPVHAGLYETNILLRAHLQPEVVALDDAWWEDYRRCCSRDQLTLTPALFRLRMPFPPLLFGPGLNARNVSWVRYTLHPPTGKENVPGRLDWANLRYHLRLCLRRCVLLLMN